MDILLDNNGDLKIEKGDLVIGDSLAQKIIIKLQWHEGEWRWNQEEGIPYMELMGKNPDLERIEDIIREKLFDLEAVTNVKEVELLLDVKKRSITIFFEAETDSETVKDEVRLWINTE